MIGPSLSDTRLAHFGCSLTQWLAYSIDEGHASSPTSFTFLTHSLTHTLTHSLIHVMSLLLTYLLTCLIACLLACSLACLVTDLITHSLTHSLTHFLTYWSTYLITDIHTYKLMTYLNLFCARLTYSPDQLFNEVSLHSLSL